MTRNATGKSRGWVGAGLALAILHLVLLSGIALFNDGLLAQDWIETLPSLAIVAIPAVLAGAGLRDPAALPWAAGISLPLAFLSLAGATLPLLIPATFYLIGYAAAARPATEAQ